MNTLRAERPGWRQEAACADHDPSLWFPENNDERRAARRICRGCPALADCLEEALRVPTSRGIRAGLTPNQINRMKKAS